MDDPNDFEWGFSKVKIGHLMEHYMIPHHVSQVIEARNVGQNDLLLPR
jgi:hypothetical protein